MRPEVLAAYYHQILSRVVPYVALLRSYLPYVGWLSLSIIILTIVLNIVKLIRNLRIPTTLLLLTPPRQTDLSAISTAQLFRLLHNLASYRPWYQRLFSPAPTYSFEIVSRKGSGIQYLLRVPADQAATVSHTLRGYLPGLLVSETDEYLAQVQKLQPTVNDYGLRTHFAKPIEERADFSSHDPIAYLTNGMTQLSGDELMAVQIVTRPLSRLHDYSLFREITKLQGKIYTNQFAHPDQHLGANLVGSGLNTGLQIIAGIVDWIGSAIGDVVDHLMDNSTLKPAPVAASAVEQPASEAEQQVGNLIKGKLEQPLFLTSIRTLVQVAPRERRSRMQGLTSSFASYTSAQLQGIVPRWSLGQPLKRWQFRRRLLGARAILSPSELAGIYHFPQSTTTHTEDLVRSRTGELPAPLSFKQADPNFDAIFATNTFGGRQTPIGQTLDERRRHTYIIGATGSGKTTLLATMIHQDIVNGKGVAVIDPHGQLVEQLLRTIPEERINDVVWFAPDDDGYPIALNLLDLPHIGDGELTPSQLQKQKSLVVSSILSIFEKFYDAKYFGPRMEYLLKNAVLAALETSSPTLVTILDLLIKQDVRREIVSRLPNGVVKDYWENEFNKLGSLQRNQTISPITNKIGGILSSPLNYNILSQSHSKLDFDEVMNSGKILLCDLSKGKIGEDESSFFGSLVIAKLQLAALRRARIPEAERRDFFLYVDEFQNFATSAFKALVSEARKYRLSTILAHQSISQIEERDIVKTILANVGTTISFRTANPEDESYLLPIFAPQVSIHEIANLPLYTCYMKVAVGQPQDAFKAEVMNFTVEPSEATAQAVIVASQARYAVPATELPLPGVAVTSHGVAAETATSIRFDTIESFTSIPIQGGSKVGNGTDKITGKKHQELLTDKQLEILDLLARYRFLTRTHLQQLLNHHHHKTIQTWLTDLTTKQYLARIDPQTETNAKTTAIYHLATNSLSYLKSTKQYDPKSLTTIYREHQRSDVFIQRCLLIADIALDLRDQPSPSDNAAVILPLEYQFSPVSSELAKLEPQAVVLSEHDQQLDVSFIEIVGDLPPKFLAQQLKPYIDIFDTNVWKVKTNQPFPDVLLIGLNEEALKTATSVMKKLLKRLDKNRPNIRLTTSAKVKEGGLFGDIWQELTESPSNAK